jgi:DASS family divalent anion:Na+ symporter
MSAKSRQLGPMSSKEKRMFAIVLLTVAAWVAEPLHHVAAHVVGLVALVALMAGGVLDKRSFRTEVSWESLVFIGTVFGLSAVFAHVGIDTWIVGVAGPVFEAMAQNPYVFVVGIGVVTVLLRFVIVSEVAYLNIVMVFLVPLAIGFGVNPWVVGIAIFATVNPWFTLYQNPVYLAAFYSVDGKMVRHADMAKYCVLYMVICLVGLAASVPYWQWMGLL